MNSGHDDIPLSPFQFLVFPLSCTGGEETNERIGRRSGTSEVSAERAFGAGLRAGI